MKRICHKCGLDWNVSVLAKSERKYICPKCERKQKKEERAWHISTGTDSNRRTATR